MLVSLKPFQLNKNKNKNKYIIIVIKHHIHDSSFNAFTNVYYIADMILLISS